MKKTNQLGFTLIELLVVISIIGLLSTLAVVSLNGARSKARDAKRQSDIKSIATAMELYSNNQSNSSFPTNGVCGGNGIVAIADTAALDATCTGSANDIKDASATYLKGLPADPGTTAYVYEGTATVYCIQATLENTAGGTLFKCNQGGQCGLTSTACTEAGL